MAQVPPVVVAFAAGIAQLMVARGNKTSACATAAGTVISAAALSVAGAAVLTFRSKGTTVDPIEVDRAQTLVAQGPFTVTRNPMYIGITGVLLGHAVLRRSGWATLPVAGFIAVMNATQIPREEAALTAKFGHAYLDYMRRVPRWLGTK